MSDTTRGADAREALADITATRGERFAVVANVFSLETPAEAVRHMVVQARRESDEGTNAVECAEDRLGAALAALDCDDMEALATLTRTEYARLFLGPREVVAPLHESAYLSGTARMFTAETLAVRAFYEAHGYVMKAKNREPEDAIGTECEFMRNLCDRLLEACGQEAEDQKPSCEADPARAGEILRAQDAFAEEHLDRWATRFTALVKSNDRSGFYAAWAAYLEDVLTEDAQLRQESERLVSILEEAAKA